MAPVSKPRRLALALGAGGLVIGLAACGGSSPAATGGSTGAGGAASATGGAGGGKIAAVIKGLDNPFFQTMEAGIKGAAADSSSDVTVQAATAITDTSGQADKLSGLAGQDFGCFVINPISGTNLIQGVAQLSAKNVPIVNIDSPIDAAAAQAASAKIATYIGTDNVEAGTMAGKTMGELLPSGGDVALIGGISGDVTSGARLDGFQKGIPANVKVVQTVAADWDRQTALTKATDIMRAQPALKGFFAANDDMGLGIARAIANAGKTGQIKVISVDGNKDAFEAIKAGGVDAVVAQYPYVIGAMGVEACRAAMAGKTLPTSVKAPVQVVTKDTVDKALASAPKPGESYDDPFAALLK
ncbi:ribose transport system substrate-binding protein/D-allose transport system substrate-binding protein [Humibacillus xanthopallidus]|uniref:Ribose transport system substrate-binding protein/D-allose transport system substrate-binding protein n=1 Tax=Humibacillus xanthopallidus TaxID=412689 RepID=A0A543PMA7_9MICO|nr:substrate-binding domain-containing protein [Humibacillus xanthopallidus]TQN45199.1 ribose transport system substrate-binding protein/D-allose transport system substrate-binding protein [Humibacillus xanthopallidus]